jgi:hypothetical protein
VLLLTNNLIYTQNLQKLSILQNKVQNVNFFRRLLDSSKKGSLKINELPKSNSIIIIESPKKNVAKLTFFSTLFFFIVFSSYPIFSKITKIPETIASKFSKKNVSQKLSQVPVFAVTNPTGQPYLANNSNGEQIGLIFFSQEDALVMLKSMQKNHQSLESRIYIMGLDKAYRMVMKNASPSGIRGNLGQELKMIFRFYPDQKQIKHANALKKYLNPIESFKGVPAFIADGLTIRKGKEEIVPIFLTKEDLQKSWSTMCKHNPDQPLKPTIRVCSLLRLISKMEESPEDFQNFGFFPPSESVDFVKRENASNPSARIMPGVFQKI